MNNTPKCMNLKEINPPKQCVKWYINFGDEKTCLINLGLKAQNVIFIKQKCIKQWNVFDSFWKAKFA